MTRTPIEGAPGWSIADDDRGQPFIDRDDDPLTSAHIADGRLTVGINDGDHDDVGILCTNIPLAALDALRAAHAEWERERKEGA